MHKLERLTRRLGEFPPVLNVLQCIRSTFYLETRAVRMQHFGQCGNE